MATLPVINGVFRCAFSWRVGTSGPTAQNVMHFFGTSGDPVSLKNALNTNVTTGMWVGTATNCSIYQLSITPLDGTSATQVFSVAGTNWAGTGTPGDYSPATATVIRLTTANRGRQNRGRLYIPFQTEQYMASGINSTSVAANQTAWDNFRSAMKTAAFPMHIASYGHSLHRTKTSGGGYTLTPVTWTPHSNEVISSTVEVTYGTQRRRQSRLR